MDFNDPSVNCHDIREAVSASIDGEDPGTSSGAVDAHLRNCASCREWREEAHRVARRLLLAPAGAPGRPDPAWKEALIALLPRRRPSVAVARSALMAVAAVEVALTVPLLVSGRVDATRDVGALEAALAVGFALVAWRPRRASGLAPVAGTAAVLLVAMEAAALATGEGALLDLVRHLMVLAGWLLVLGLARSRPPRAADGERVRPRGGRRHRHRAPFPLSVAHGGRAAGPGASAVWSTKARLPTARGASQEPAA